ncbi:MAG TPA: hypothetical protein VMU77_06150 [Acidimicrobiales bacterium]|nr:hypothetical protein [Acidimicrobiales bacterium]
MRGLTWPRRTRGITALLAVGGLGIAGLSGCSTSTHSTAKGTPLVSFVQTAAVSANGPIPHNRSALLNCGSAQYGWLSELTHVSVSQAKVAKHWGPFIPSGPVGPDGQPAMAKQMMASGTIASFSAGGTDVPFDHPYGGDASFDFSLAPAYSALDQAFPIAGKTYPANQIHDEIQTGLIPHVAGSDAITAGETWPNFANADVNSFAPGFTPQSGDQAAVMGSWVTDCGHRDFHPELHGINFMASGHKSGNSTIAHAFYNPYEVSQLYNPDTSVSGKVTDPSVLSSKSTQDILHYIVTAITRLAAGQDQAPTVPQVLVPFTSSPAPWQVCAPSGTSGSKLNVSYDFSIRNGVSVSIAPNDSTGCAIVTTKLTASYQPANAPGQMECPTDWNWLDSNALGNGGVGQVNIPQMILQQVQAISPSLAASLASKVNAPVVSNCYPPLSVGGLASPGSGMHNIVTVPGQVMPFAGWVQVSWGS